MAMPPATLLLLFAFAFVFVVSRYLIYKRPKAKVSVVCIFESDKRKKMLALAGMAKCR